MNTLSPHVAIVDDEGDTITLLKKTFSKRKIPVSFVAYNGVEAVDLFKSSKTKPDVIIMDQRMPMANGIEAMKQILEIAPDVKVLFLSADPEIEQDALKAGAAGFMKKPTKISDIVAAVRAAI